MVIKKRGQINLNAIILICLILIVVSGAGGYFLGKNSMKEYKTIVDEFFPEPPEEIFSIVGTIQEISGDSFKVETSSMERYFPGKELKTIILTINTNQDTKILENQLSPSRDIIETTISFSELNIGDYVTINSEENIRDKNQITAEDITKLTGFDELI